MNENAPTAILAVGKNWELPVPADRSKIQLSIDSRLTAMAAGILYAEGAAKRIVFSTGKTAGEEYPTEAGEQFDWMRRYFTPKQIPDSRVILAEKSFDTAGNVEEARKMVEEGLVSGFHLLTVGYHLPRLRKLAERYDLPVIGASASDKVVGRSELAVPDLRGSSHYYGRLVLREARKRRSARPLVRTAAQLGLEAVANTLIIADPNGDGISRLVTARLRHRNS